jgi:hypothetical protein
MDRPYDVITFDCYGTLIDWERGLRDGFAAAAAASGRPVDTAAALRLFAEIEPAVQARPSAATATLLAETGRRVAVRMGWPLPAARAGFLAESMPRLDALPGHPIPRCAAWPAPATSSASSPTWTTTSWPGRGATSRRPSS